ncbi:MAG TPA: hypothetical protein VHE99_03990 [Gammaproteobacteria bacterium]|nr:hypothetical protein [Gammaproteobacteria bacterium]
MRIFALTFFLLVSLLPASYASLPQDTASLTLYTTEQAAQKHCPDDEVVWLNTNSGIWHSRNGRWYGNTKHGSYACKQEAAAAGNRASLNG